MTINKHKTLDDLEREAYSTQNFLALDIYERWEDRHDSETAGCKEAIDRLDDEVTCSKETIDTLNSDLEELQSQYDALAEEHAQMISPLDRNNEGE